MDMLANSQELIRGFAALLAAIEQVNNLNPRAGSTPSESTPARNPLEARDTFTSYEEKQLPNGNLVRRYDNGAVRVLNLRSGIVQEERINGNLLVSLPTGRVIFQEQPGYPLLVFNSVQGGPPVLARVCIVQLGTGSEASPSFQFEDEEGNHFIDLDTLRYVRVAPNVHQLEQATSEDLSRSALVKVA